MDDTFSGSRKSVQLILLFAFLAHSYPYYVQMELSISLLDRDSDEDCAKIEALNATLEVLKTTIMEVRQWLVYLATSLVVECGCK